MTRANSAYLDAIIENGHKFPVLDHGFTRVVDYMGDDSAIVQAARVSYGAGTKAASDDRGLIRYLMRNRHTSPFEMCEIKLHVKLPIFVARQWIRHRTACLTGDNLLQFDEPARLHLGKRKSRKMRVDEIFSRFQPTTNKIRPDKQRNPYFKKERVQGMRLRSCNEYEGSTYHTSIVDVWQNGVKPVVRVAFDNGGVLRATKDHLCLTVNGWMKLGDALHAGVSFLTSAKRDGHQEPNRVEFTAAEIDGEEWRAIPESPEYEVSSLGRVRSWRNTRGVKLATPVIKNSTFNRSGYQVVSLSLNGKSRARLVHRLVGFSFLGLSPKDQINHTNHNRSDNRISNLEVCTPASNCAARMAYGNNQRLDVAYTKVTSWYEDGEEMTYDIEVAGPWHNFQCGGVFVHNSVNEVSGRYSIVPNEFYIPEIQDIQPQAKDNKQGRNGEMPSHDAETFQRVCASNSRDFDDYEQLVGIGIARELARINLPLSTYTEWYWKIDLHNLFHFLSLRCDPHAQKEIRAYAEVIASIVEGWVPEAYKAWEDYRLHAATFSRMELDILRDMLDNNVLTWAIRSRAEGEMSNREIDEFVAKLVK